MANTYSQIIVQLIFSVRNRKKLIPEIIREEVEKYISGIVKAKKSRPLAIYCNPDHCHILVGLHPTVSIAELARDIKSGSSGWINKQNVMNGHFNWQSGYGAFTYSRDQLTRVVSYILGQHDHHKKKTLREEYMEMLQEADIEFDERYIF